MRNAGASLKEIGRTLGVSAERARQIVSAECARRERARRGETIYQLSARSRKALAAFGLQAGASKADVSAKFEELRQGGRALGNFGRRSLAEIKVWIGSTGERERLISRGAQLLADVVQYHADVIAWNQRHPDPDAERLARIVEKVRARFAAVPPPIEEQMESR